MSEKTMFDSAVEKIQTAFGLLEKAMTELETLGINVNNFTGCGVGARGYGNNVLLRSGINKVSILTEKEIEPIYADSSFGAVFLDGFYIDQQKLPVERQDRYA